MERALVIGASGGIGSQIVLSLKARGVSVETLSRQEDGFDFGDPNAVVAQLAQLTLGYDLIFVASGILQGTAPRPEKSLRELNAGEMIENFRVNCVGPALVLQAARRLLPRDRRAVFAALSARVGSIGDNRKGGWYSYRSAKAALNQTIRTGAIELARTHKQSICVALHPGTVGTDFSLGYDCPSRLDPAFAAGRLLEVLETLSPADTGRFYDWKGEEVPW